MWALAFCEMWQPARSHTTHEQVNQKCSFTEAPLFASWNYAKGYSPALSISINLKIEIIMRWQVDRRTSGTKVERQSIQSFRYYHPYRNYIRFNIRLSEVH